MSDLTRHMYDYRNNDGSTPLCHNLLTGGALVRQLITNVNCPACLELHKRDQEGMRDCDYEFGPDHTHDDAECARILATMAGEGVDDGSWYAEAYNREAEESMLGRPLFPNEY